MKKTLFLVAIAAIIFSSCKKEHGLTTKTSSTKKYAVNIQVSNFTASHANFALRTKGSHLASSDTLTDLASYVDLLYYVVLDGNYKIVKTIVYDSTYCSAMGTITDSLPAGNYNIAIVAGKKGLAVATSSVATYYNYGGNPWQDTFWSLFPLTVGNQDASLTTTLNRVVGKLEVTLLDNIPANADSLFISVAGDAFEKDIRTPLSFDQKTTRFAVGIPASAKGKPNFTIDRLLGAIEAGVDVTITCNDAGGHAINSITAYTVIIHTNQKTILSGNLFNNSSPQSFTAKVDTAWSSGITQVGFSLKHH
jgi:hypothetical protein